MNSFDYWFDYIVRNGEYKYVYGLPVWIIEINEYVYRARFESERNDGERYIRIFKNGEQYDIVSGSNARPLTQKRLLSGLFKPLLSRIRIL